MKKRKTADEVTEARSAPQDHRRPALEISLHLDGIDVDVKISKGLSPSPEILDQILARILDQTLDRIPDGSVVILHRILTAEVTHRGIDANGEMTS